MTLLRIVVVLLSLLPMVSCAGGVDRVYPEGEIKAIAWVDGSVVFLLSPDPEEVDARSYIPNEVWKATGNDLDRAEQLAPRGLCAYGDVTAIGRSSAGDKLLLGVQCDNFGAVYSYAMDGDGSAILEVAVDHAGSWLQSVSGLADGTFMFSDVGSDCPGATSVNSAGESFAMRAGPERRLVREPWLRSNNAFLECKEFAGEPLWLAILPAARGTDQCIAVSDAVQAAEGDRLWSIFCGAGFSSILLDEVLSPRKLLFGLNRSLLILGEINGVDGIWQISIDGNAKKLSEGDYVDFDIARLDAQEFSVVAATSEGRIEHLKF